MVRGELIGIQDKIIEVQDKGYCILKEHFASPRINACRDAFWPLLLTYLRIHGNAPNRGPHRHYLPMPFEPPCFNPEFFFDHEVLNIVRGVMDDRVVADQWGCDVVLWARTTRTSTSTISVRCSAKLLTSRYLFIYRSSALA